jgi:predicted metal-dependent phosphoesterase TrpH
MRLDLHIHTNASDGAWSPSQVVKGAADGGLHVIAISDHDTTAGVEEARAAAAEHRVEVIPALEVSSTWEGREIHVLGYFVDPGAPELQEHARHARTRRGARMEEMVARLVAAGIDVTMDDVLEAAGDEAGALARPHLARALVERGHVGSVPAAFATLIGDEHPAFVPTELMSPLEAVDMIHQVGGVAMWAHPPLDLLDVLLPLMEDGGLDGLEVYRASNKRNAVVRLEAACRARGMLRSGGSDWHTPDSGHDLGDFHVTAQEVEELLERGGI